MVFTCPLCRSEYIYISKLCCECDKIRFLMSVYNRETIINILNKVLVVQQFKQIKEEEKKEDEEYEKHGNKWKRKSERIRIQSIKDKEGTNSE